MKIIQIVKKLNNTEIGKSGTHETYVHIPQELNISDLFPETDVHKQFIYKRNKQSYQIRCTIGREKRIVGLGDFYRDNDVCAGDEIVLEKHILPNNESKFYIDLNKLSNILMVQRCKGGFEILNEDRLSFFNNDFNTYSLGEKRILTIEFVASEKKRADSPKTTNIFDIKIDGISAVENYNRKDMIEIQFDVESKIASISKACAWKKYVFEVEE
ncbi:MAG: hypothetical protein ACLSXC_06035 [Beduini sp.]